jgi:hypothetical protein
MTCLAMFPLAPKMITFFIVFFVAYVCGAARPITNLKAFILHKTLWSFYIPTFLLVFAPPQYIGPRVS